MSLNERVLIIGSGPCGLGAGYRLHELGHKNWKMVDREQRPGGLARSFADEQGFKWDIGAHVIFSHFDYFSRLLDRVIPAEEWLEHQRVCFVWMRRRWIPYPMQNNIWRLPADELVKCLEGLVDVDRMQAQGSTPKLANFHDWMKYSFGDGLTQSFMLPYNCKVWATHPKNMNVQWMGERVAKVDVKKIMQNVVLQQDSLGWGPNATFRYPLHGGIGAIYDAIHARLPQERVEFGKDIVKIDATDKRVFYANGSSDTYDKLLSTMPLDLLCRCVTRLPGMTDQELRTRADGFFHSSTHIVGLGMKGKLPKELEGACWLYFPEDDCPFYRVTVISNFSPDMVPDAGNTWSLQLEIAESKYRPVPDTREKIIEWAVQGCLNTTLIHPEDVILSKFYLRLEHGYPTPFYGRDELCAPIFEALEKADILSRGRFGAWKYEIANQDHTTMQGVEAANHMVYGTTEMCFRHPRVVNQHKEAKGLRLLPSRL